MEMFVKMIGLGEGKGKRIIPARDVEFASTTDTDRILDEFNEVWDYIPEDYGDSEVFSVDYIDIDSKTIPVKVWGKGEGENGDDFEIEIYSAAFLMNAEGKTIEKLF